jgi:hypothetical protein
LFNDTEKIISYLKDNYNVDTEIKHENLQLDDFGYQNADMISVKGSNNTYPIYDKMFKTDGDLEEYASFIINSNDISVPTETKTPECNTIKVGETYKYEPTIIMTDNKFVEESKLNKLNGNNCKVIEKLITSDEETDEFYEVEFVDKPEESFVVFGDDLIEVPEASTSNSVTEVNTSTALLTALQSEKEAVVTYEILINQSEDKDEIELLQKILDDEKEHVALLSGLQSAKTADFVADDNKEDLDSYAQDIIESDSRSEG